MDGQVATGDVMAQKSDDWFVGIFTRYGRVLRRYLRRFSVNDETAADLAQEAFLRTYQASNTESIKHPRAFLFQTARNLALNDIRNRKRQGQETVADFDDLGVYNEYPSLESAQISREEFEVLCDAIEELPPKCQRVFVLRKIYQYSYKEISAELGIAISTVEKHVAKGATACHRYLSERGHDVGGVADESARIMKLGEKHSG